MAPKAKANSADGMLTTSGLLYEGNLIEWLGRIDATLVLHNLSRHTSSQARFFAGIAIKYGSTDVQVAQRRQAERLIRSMVSPHLLGRLTNFDYTPAELFRTLKMLAQPFRRLLDLPPELRESIYVETFSHAGVVMVRPKCITIGLAPELDKDSLAPNLLQVSQQTRTEASPIFYKITHFAVLLDIDGDWGFRNINEGLDSWLEEVVKENKQHIHHMVLELQWTGDHGHYLKCFGFDHHGAQGGLKVKLPVDLEEKSKARVEEHLAAITKSVEAPGVQLISALLNGKELWELSSLAYTSDVPETPF